MEPTITTLTDNITETLPRYAAALGRSLQQTMQRAGKGITRRVISITPPARSAGGSEASGTASTAYKQGRNKIKRQMNSVLAPRTLKHVRRERHPDVATTYKQARRTTQDGKVQRNGKVFYVDRRKYLALQKKKEGHVGRMASGWGSAAHALQVPLPAWVSRHGRARGSIKQSYGIRNLSLRVINFAPNVSSDVRAELARRIPYAVLYQKAAMIREMNYMVFKTAQEHAIKTRNFAMLVPAGMQGGGV